MIPALIVALVLQASPLACTAEEVAAYEARGWDAYECDGDKAAQMAGEFNHDEETGQ